MAYFQFWQDAEMTQSLDFLSFSRDLAAQTNESRKGVAYFGCKQTYLKLQTTTNAGVDNVLIYPAETLTAPERNTDYSLSATGCNDFIVNGFVFRLKTAGKTATSMPAYNTELGAIVNDGTVQFQCVSVAHKASEIRLSLSEDGLNNAAWGQALSLGNTVFGGAEISVYYEILDSVENPFNDTPCPQLCISINECTESLID